MKYERAILIGAGALAGMGVVCFARSKLGRKAAVAVVSKGLRLRECVAGIAERTKETIDDVIAEAKSVNEQNG
jgi:acetyltransferase-like isoleucine patch superfamily enzyme